MLVQAIASTRKLRSNGQRMKTIPVRHWLVPSVHLGSTRGLDRFPAGRAILRWSSRRKCRAHVKTPVQVLRPEPIRSAPGLTHPASILTLRPIRESGSFDYVPWLPVPRSRTRALPTRLNECAILFGVGSQRCYHCGPVPAILRSFAAELGFRSLRQRPKNTTMCQQGPRIGSHGVPR